MIVTPRTYLLAELGSCHDGDWGKVVRLVRACAAASFSACKLQYWSDADRLADRRRATPCYRDVYRRYAIPADWLPRFRALCHAEGVEAVCTVYLPEDVPVVAPHVDRLKVASFENEDTALLDACLATGKPVIVSEGMTPGILPWRLPRGRRKASDRALVLACVSAYPAPLDGALARLFVSNVQAEDSWPGYYAGYSDHTRNVWTGACAVAAGASVIEVHVRLDDTRPENPDYQTALDETDLRRYAEGVRVADRLIADVPVDESEMARFKVRAGQA